MHAVHDSMAHGESNPNGPTRQLLLGCASAKSNGLPHGEEIGSSAVGRSTSSIDFCFCRPIPESKRASTDSTTRPPYALLSEDTLFLFVFGSERISPVVRCLLSLRCQLLLEENEVLPIRVDVIALDRYIGGYPCELEACRGSWDLAKSPERPEEHSWKRGISLPHGLYEGNYARKCSDAAQQEWRR